MKSPSVTELEEFDAKELGAVMHETRENLGHELEQVAKDLRIRPIYLEAIEAGRLSELPGNAYVLGFLRVYSDYLGLDGQEVVRRFKMAGTEITDKPSLDLPSPLEDGRMPTALILLVGIIIAIFAYVGWNYLSSPDIEPARSEPQLPDKLSERKESVIDQGLRDQAREQMDSSSYQRPMSLAAGIPTEPGSVIKKVDEGNVTRKFEEPDQSAQDSAALVLKRARPLPSTAIPKKEQITTARIQRPSALSRVLIVLRAIDNTYVLIKNNDNDILFAQLMRPGDIYEVPMRVNLILETGNAGGLQVAIGDKKAFTLGTSGEVLRNIPLNVESLLSARN